jgi:hypothetical protein
VFLRSGSGSWILKQKMTAPDGGKWDQFGWSVSVGGETIVIGAPGKSSGQGCAYVFRSSGGSWVPSKILNASDAFWFGKSVSASGDTVVIGAPLTDNSKGAAYAFLRSGGSWVQKQLPASDGDRFDQLGSSVSVGGNTAVVGARLHNNSKGAAYVFVLA